MSGEGEEQGSDLGLPRIANAHEGLRKMLEEIDQLETEQETRMEWLVAVLWFLREGFPDLARAGLLAPGDRIRLDLVHRMILERTRPEAETGGRPPLSLDEQTMRCLALAGVNVLAEHGKTKPKARAFVAEAVTRLWREVSSVQIRRWEMDWLQEQPTISDLEVELENASPFRTIEVFEQEMKAKICEKGSPDLVVGKHLECFSSRLKPKK